MPDDVPSSDQAAEPREVLVPFGRLAGWISRYDDRHPGTDWTVQPDQVRGVSPDGANAAWNIPWPPLLEPTLDGLVAHLTAPRELGILLVRRGGFAVGHVVGDRISEAKVGRRHVQGRSKAGGWSQQRFARRRDNQAREAYEAAAGHAARLLVPVVNRLAQLVLGGDDAGVRAVLEDRRLAELADVPQQWVHGVADPRRADLDAAIERARSVRITVVDPSR